MEEKKQIDQPLQSLIGQNEELRDRVAVLERQNGSLGADVPLEQYRNIIESSNAAIGMIRADGVFLMINQTGASLLDSIPERLCNRNIADCLPGELSEMAMKGIEKVLTSRKGNKKERMIHIDREERWIDANIQPARDTNGEVTGIQFIIHDITERKKTERVLNERVKELNCLFGISRLVRKNRTIEDILQGIVNLIIPSWEYPMSTCARITLADQEFRTGNFKETVWKQSSCIRVYGKEEGAVEVYYLKEKPRRDEGPFSREERELLDAIAGQLGKITERLRAEEEIKQARDDYRAISDLTGDIIVKVDTEGRWTFLNIGACKFWSKPKKELMGSAFADYLHPDDYVNTVDVVEKVKRGRVVKGLINRQETPDGWRVVEWNAASLVDNSGNYIGFQATGRDITDRREAEAALRASEIKYRTLFETSTEGIIFADIETKKFEYANKTLCEMLGYNEAEIAEKCVLDIHPKDSLAHVIDEFMAQANGEKILAEDIPCLKKDGTIIYADINTQPLVINGRKYNVGFFRDVTDRKRAEEEKAALEAQLRQGEKLRAVGELAGGIAHDFNNMLGAISGYADLIEETNRDGQGNVKDEDLQKRVAVISRASGRAADLVAKLLTFSRRGKFRNMPLDIHEVVNDVIALLESSVDRKITLEKRFTARNTIVKGDSSRIQNAILNICINACDAMKNGGVLKISTENLTLHERQYHVEIKAGNYIKLSVRDTGSGMDREMLDRIFEPFYTTKEVGEGTGLGLSSALGTMQSHNGYITVESVIDQGTTFDVYIPLETQKIVLKEEIRDKKIVKGTGTILIVDDEDMLRDMVEEILTDCGYTVHTFGDSVEAVSWYKKNHAAIDLVLLDMVMPKMDGLDCFDEMREVNSGVKVVLASGYSKNYKVQKLLSRGVKAFIEKPFDKVTLSRTIARVLKNGHALIGKSIRKKKVVVKQGKGV